ncbi:MAG: hypothetical protein P8L18_06935 [Verrucomicrobiota bacterium]|nr:hypothetical protein [Verrucomicrobiota bacterium]
MKIWTSWTKGMAWLLCGFLLGCGQWKSPIDSKGFVTAFNATQEPQGAVVSVGDTSRRMVGDILEALRDAQFEEARQGLESLRRQNDLSPLQRLETKALHTLIVRHLSEVDQGNFTQKTSHSTVPPA